MNLSSGVLLDNRYELLELLGEGGMGQVFKARHNRLGKIFAIKTLRHLSPNPKEQAQFLEAFETEARILAELDHRALAKVSDFFETNGVHFLVMEFIDGKTLSRVVELAPRNLSQRRVLQWATELCEVLQYLHHQNPPVIVRDLKPDNIMIDSKRRLRLLDFGISKRLKPGVGTRDIVKGMGTAEYAPLEQYGSSTTDQRSDIYALGATLYFLLTEIAPPPAWKRASEGVQPVAPSTVNPTLDSGFESLILSMMSLKKEDRPASVEHVLEVLQGFQNEKKQRELTKLQAPPAAKNLAGSQKPQGVWAKVPEPPEYSSAKPAPAQRYGMPGSALDYSKTVVSSSLSLSIQVVSCRSLRRYADTPQVVKVCPGKPYFAVAGRYLQLWNLETEQIKSKLWSGEQHLTALDFSPDGRSLFAAELEGKIRHYDIQTGKKKKTLGRRSWGLFPDKVRAICYLKTPGLLAIASDTSNVRLFEKSVKKSQKTLDWHQGGLFSKMGRKTLSLSLIHI